MTWIARPDDPVPEDVARLLVTVPERFVHCRPPYLVEHLERISCP